MYVRNSFQMCRVHTVCTSRRTWERGQSVCNSICRGWKPPRFNFSTCTRGARGTHDHLKSIWWHVRVPGEPCMQSKDFMVAPWLEWNRWSTQISHPYRLDLLLVLIVDFTRYSKPVVSLHRCRASVGFIIQYANVNWTSSHPTEECTYRSLVSRCGTWTASAAGSLSSLS